MRRLRDKHTSFGFLLLLTCQTFMACLKEMQYLKLNRLMDTAKVDTWFYRLSCYPYLTWLLNLFFFINTLQQLYMLRLLIQGKTKIFAVTTVYSLCVLMMNYLAFLVFFGTYQIPCALGIIEFKLRFHFADSSC